MPQNTSYDALSKWLHWLIAAFVLAQFTTGWIWGYFERGSDPRFYLFRTHIYLGYAILALAVVRLIWRFCRPAVAPLPDMSRPMTLAAHAAHGLLYLAILVQPVLGILASTAFGKSLGRWPSNIHIGLARVIAAIVILHVAAALWHQFVRRDRILSRMLPEPKR